MDKSSGQALIRIPLDTGAIEGMLEWPENPAGIVLFAHGSGSSRFSPRNNFVANRLRGVGMATLLVDLLTVEEDRDYARRFDIARLTQRLVQVSRHLADEPAAAALPLGVFGASTGAAAALRFAAAEPDHVRAVVSRGGRPDLAGDELLARVRAPTLLIVGGADTDVIELNRSAHAALGGVKELRIVPGATHLFEEPGALEEVADLAAAWFSRHLASEPTGPEG